MRLWTQCGDNPELQDLLDDRRNEALLGNLKLQLLRLPTSGRRETALLAPVDGDVRVNGQPIVGGLKVLEHRDELSSGGCVAWFSVEGTPVVVPFALPSDDPRPNCPVCRKPLADGQSAVHCPGCNHWYHEIAPDANGNGGKQCWTYGEKCKYCAHPTPLDGRSEWRPESEEVERDA